ncbi:hypothetical protein EV401DRAFT_1895815 [Pisolithus croceorrhizus]|nr:hypothetical protein EV401DRAFT_1895815 [Pisolithus croceorrhizus]
MSNQPSSSCQPTNTTSWDWTQVPDVDLRVHTSNSEGTEEAKEAKKGRHKVARKEKWAEAHQQRAEEAWLERECLEWEEHKKWEQEECERQEHEECEEKERWEALAVACQATVAEVEAAQQSVTKDKGRVYSSGQVATYSPMAGASMGMLLQTVRGSRKRKKKCSWVTVEEAETMAGSSRKRAGMGSLQQGLEEGST